jgi:hypothetical protein
VRFKPTLILLFIAGLAIAYFFFIEQPGHRERIASEEQAQQLTDLSGEEVRGLIIRQNDALLAFVMPDDAWQMISPVDDRADQASVNVVIGSIVNARIEERFDADEARLVQYGLADPLATIELRDSVKANLLTLDIGNLNLTKSHCYGKRQGSNEVLLLPTGIRRYASRTVFEFREKKITDFPLDRVTELRIDSDVLDVTWKKDPQGDWLTNAGRDTIRGDREAITTILRELRALRAEEFLQTSAAANYFADPAGVITLRTGNASPLEFAFARSDSQRCYVRTSENGRISGVSVAALDVFGRTFDDLRDRHVLRFDGALLAKIMLETPTTSISIVRLGGEWSFANPSFGTIEQADVGLLLQGLAKMRYREIAEEHVSDPAAYGLAAPEYRLALYDSDEQLIDELRTGSDPAVRQTYFATSQSTGLLGIVDAELIQGIERTFKSFQLQ